MKNFITETYEASKPSFSQYGANICVYFKDDSYMELDVDMFWDSRTDTVQIDTFQADYYDEDDNVLEVDIDKTENMIIDICEYFNTFGSVENEMVKAYIADHE